MGLAWPQNSVIAPYSSLARRVLSSQFERESLFWRRRCGIHGGDLSTQKDAR
jgi:hypothetical protein